MRKTMNEHILRIKYLNKYALNESPKYSIVDGIEEDDMPDFMQKVTPVSHNDSNVMEDEETEMPVDNLAAGEGVPQPEEPTDDENTLEPEMEVPTTPTDIPTEPVDEKPSPDEIQNDIIKSNIEVMKKLNQKITDLEDMAKSLTLQNAKMEREVEEVREPTNVEKLTKRKDDSHPYYYGLNDMWEGNWFQARRDKLGENGIKKLEDGSYVADFDDLPKLSSQEVKDSFNNI